MTMKEALRLLRSAPPALSRRAASRGLSCLNWVVFAGLDIADELLCPVFALLDFFFDSETRGCYCQSQEIQESDKTCSTTSKELLSRTGAGGFCSLESWTRSSDSLYARVRRSGRAWCPLLPLPLLRIISSSKDNVTQSTNSCKGNELDCVHSGLEGSRGASKRWVTPNPDLDLRSLTELSGKSGIGSHKTVKHGARWSDCGCQRCTAWQLDADQLLYVHVDDKDFVASVGNGLNATNKGVAAENNIIFLHGFLSSSFFWTDTVLPALPASVRTSHRLFAVDMMGFGRSPKPSDSLYTIADHIDMIRRSVLEPNGIRSFHLVAHSMGCTIALALAAQCPSALNSITLIAPPYFPAISKDPSGACIMEQVAARRVWPLITFCSSVMSWYEHIGRVVCFVVCKHHRFWEPILNFLHSKLPGKRAPLSSVADFTQHTHHSAWHVFHNTICTGGYAADHCLEVLRNAGKTVRVIHGTRDVVIPFENSVSLSKRHPNVLLTPVPYTDHTTVVFGREAELAEELSDEILAEHT